MRQLHDSNYLPRDALLNVLAGAVEHDPCAIDHWEQLVIELGAIERVEYHDKCLHHEKSIESKEQSWWGTHRVVEWQDQFFYAPKVVDVPEKPEFVRTVTDIVETFLPPNDHGPHAQWVSAKHSKDASIIPDPIECMGWIWDPLDDEPNVEPLRTKQIIDIAILPNDMPPIKLESTQELFDPDIQENLALNPSCKALCMKILVAGHLTGVHNQFVCNSVWWFAVNLWQSASNARVSDTRNHYADGLAWLAMHGIDISLHLQCRLKRSEAVSIIHGDSQV